MENALSRLMTVAGLALFIGAGVLAFRISDTWTEVNTQAVINGVTMVCGGVGVLAALLLAVLVGIPLGRRIEERREDRRMVDRPVRVSLPSAPAPRGWDAPPPMLTAKPDDTGTWQSGGPAAYNLWDEEPQAWGDAGMDR